MSKRHKVHRSQSSAAGVHPLPKDNTLDLGVKDGNVVIQFASPIAQMTFSPAQARELGQGFIEMAVKAEAIMPRSPSLREMKSSSKRTH